MLSETEQQSARRLIALALEEDLGTSGDITSNSLIDASHSGTVSIVARKPGVLCGTVLIPLILQQVDQHGSVQYEQKLEDGETLAKGALIATLSGPTRILLTAERTILNFLTHLSGVATLTAEFVSRVSGTKAQILDTRKTHPGYRLLEKYAVRCGRGKNHRIGLFDEAMIKDNHLAAFANSGAAATIPAAIAKVREQHPGIVLTLEVDTLEQLQSGLESDPNIILLDNMTLDQLREAVALRDEKNPQVLLEASGGVNLDTVRDIAQTGVDRISVGAMTHSAVALDLGFDWINLR